MFRDLGVHNVQADWSLLKTVAVGKWTEDLRSS